MRGADPRETARLLLEEFLHAEAALAGAIAGERPAAEQRYADTWRRISEYVLSGAAPDPQARLFLTESLYRIWQSSAA